MTKEKEKAKGVVEVNEAVELLRGILRDIENRTVVVETEGQPRSLWLPDRVKFEVKAEQKHGKGELSLEVSWKEGLELDEDFGLRFGTHAQSSVNPCIRTEILAQGPALCAEC